VLFILVYLVFITGWLARRSPNLEYKPLQYIVAEKEERTNPNPNPKPIVASVD
jgi:hypothetical protein